MKRPITHRLLLGLFASASFASLPPLAQAATYSLAGDFSYDANPNGVWSYRIDDYANNPPMFPLLTSTDLDANTLWGTAFPTPPTMWSEGTGYWGIGQNTTGGDLFDPNNSITWGANEIFLHPKGGASPARLVIAWTAPEDLLIDVNYTFARAMTCGNGVGYQLLKRSGGVDTVVEDFGVGGTTDTGPITRSQLGMAVTAGDQLFWRIDNWADAGCDITRASIEINGTTLGEPPAILTPPVGGTVAEGDDFTFSVSATGAQTYEWSKDGAPISGATGPTYTINDVALTDAGNYSVTVSNAAGTDSSTAVTLNVTPAPVFGSYLEAVLTSNPIHYYPLDDTSGTTATDLGSLATVGGTYLGGFTLGAPSASPLLGTSVRLDGASGTLVDLGVFHPGDAVSVEAWFQVDPSARTGWNAIVSRFDGSYELANNSDLGISFALRNDANTIGQVFSATPPARGQWHHVVGVFTGGTLTVYVDGVKGGDQTIGGVLQDAGPTPDRVMIGATRDGTGGSAFNLKGWVDEVAIYDHALSASEIRGHYRQVTSVTPSLAIQKAVIVSWPNFPPGYVLQWATDVNGPYEDFTGSVYLEGNNFIAPVPTSATQQFFQLSKP